MGKTLGGSSPANFLAAASTTPCDQCRQVGRNVLHQDQRAYDHASRIVDEHFAEEQPHLTALPAIPYSAVLTVERRVSHDGMVSVGGNLYSVPDATRKRVVEVQNHPKEVRIFEDRVLIAVHPVLEGKNQRRVEPSHRKIVPPILALYLLMPPVRREMESYLSRLKSGEIRRTG